MVTENNERKLNLGLKLRSAGATGKKLHVASRKGQWIIFKEGVDKVISEFPTRENAILNGKKLMHSSHADALVVHNADGSVKRIQMAK